MLTVQTGSHHSCRTRLTERMSKWIGFNFPVDILQITPETSLSSQSLALVLTTKPELPRDRTWTTQDNQKQLKWP